MHFCGQLSSVTHNMYEENNMYLIVKQQEVLEFKTEKGPCMYNHCIYSNCWCLGHLCSPYNPYNAKPHYLFLVN